MTRRPLELTDRALVPVELEPAQRVEDLLDVLGGRPLTVGVLDPEHQRSARSPGREPVVQCRPRAADVERTCWRGGESNSKGIFHADRGACFHSGRPVRTRSSAASSATARRSRSSTRARAPGDRRSSEPDDFAAFNEAFEASPLGSTVIHAVYLINTCEPRSGDQREVAGVADPRASARRRDRRRRRRPARRLTQAGPPRRGGAPARATLVREALAETETLPGAVREHRRDDGPARPRLRASSPSSSRRPAPASGSGSASTSCHLFASGFDIVEPDALSSVVDDLDRRGRARPAALRCTSTTAPCRSGANRDKHANVGEGEMGERGIATFLSEPRFEDLPAVLETPGTGQEGLRLRRGQAGQGPPRPGPDAIAS